VGIYYWRVETWDNQDAEGDWSACQAIIVDMLKISAKDAADSRTDIETSVDVYFNITREYDNALFEQPKGTVYINDSAAIWDETKKYWKITVTQSSVGKWVYQVSNITDMEYGITAINDQIGAQQVVWDKLIVAITPDATNVTVGTEVSFKVTAVYAYDGKEVPAWTVSILRDGLHFANNNFTDTSPIAITHQYAIERVAETTFGLETFTSNLAIVTWTKTQKTLIQVVVDWIVSNALVVITTIQIIAVLLFLLTMERRKHANPRK
jgi:hypothetical protein